MFHIAELKITLGRLVVPDTTDEASYTIRATKTGPETDFIFTRGAPVITQKGLPSGDIITKMCKTFHPDNFKVQFTLLEKLDETYTIFEAEFDEMAQLRATDIKREEEELKREELDENDETCFPIGVVEVYRHFYFQCSYSWHDQVVAACEQLQKRDAIKGEKCPITHEQLTMSCVKLPCNHYISEEGAKGMIKSSSASHLKCPLCRNEFHRALLLK